MKRLNLVFVFVVFIAMSIVTSCSTPAEKVENAQDNVVSANEELDNANQEYLADIENYRVETNEKIAANDKSIAEFKTRVEHQKSEAKDDYEKRISELEQKNSDMKMEMDSYKAGGKEKWESFKTEFSHDMDELGQSLKDLTVKNTK